MKRLIAFALLPALAVALGCESNNADHSAEAPPPPPAETTTSSSGGVVETSYADLSTPSSDTQSTEVIYVEPEPATDFNPPEPATHGETTPMIQPMQTAPVSTGGGEPYTVQKGDTLWSIAKRYYGDGQKWREIVAANPGLDPRKLRVGQQINLP